MSQEYYLQTKTIVLKCLVALLSIAALSTAFAVLISSTGYLVFLVFYLVFVTFPIINIYRILHYKNVKLLGFGDEGIVVLGVEIRHDDIVSVENPFGNTVVMKYRRGGQIVKAVLPIAFLDEKERKEALDGLLSLRGKGREGG